VNKSSDLLKLLRATFALCLLLCVAGCGGGLAGSGNGGGSPKPPTDDKYLIGFLPGRIAAAIPVSLSQDNAYPDWFDGERPRETVALGVGKLIDQQIALGLMQIYVDSSWISILQYCSANGLYPKCSLENSGLVVRYTTSMALYEIDLREELIREKRGVSGAITTQEQAEIRAYVNAKIGTAIPLDTLVLEQYEGEDFGYFVKMQINERAPLMCALSWDELQKRVRFNVTANDADHQEYFELDYDKTGVRPRYSFQLTREDATYEQEIRVSVSKLPDSNKVFVDSQLTESTGLDEKEINALGHADATGGYLLSESTVVNAGVSEILKHREVFNETLTGAAVCDPAVSASGCDEDEAWQTVLGIDPLTSPYYVSTDELEKYRDDGARLQYFALVELNGVHDSSGSFALIDSSKASVSVGGQDVLLDVEDYGEFRWSGSVAELSANDNPVLPSPEQVIDAYNKSVVCRITPTTTGVLRSFCLASKESIENAYVLKESYIGGWLSTTVVENAQVSIVE